MISKFEEPLLVTRSFLPPFEKFVEKISNVWDNRWLTNQGPSHQQFEERLKDYLHAENVTLFTNGHLALDSALRVLRLHGEVITTPFTFVSTTHAIVMNGLKPVFCDIKSDYTIDEDKIESLITEQTTAIVPVHVYGNPCNIQKIQKIAERYNLKVIYDAAHAFGVEVDGKPIGNFGDISMFSFHATKVFHTIEGGALVYNDETLKKELDLLKNFGISGPEEIELVSYNAKMNEFQAAMGILNLDYIDANIENRKKITQEYHRNLSDIPGIAMKSSAGNIKSNYAYLPVLIDKSEFGMTRNQLYDTMIGYNIYSRKYFYPLITNTTAYAGYNANIPNAEHAAERILCLPIFSDMTSEQAVKVCDIIKEIHYTTKHGV